MSSDSKKLFDQIIPYITEDLFAFPKPADVIEYFPDFLEDRLETWFTRYAARACRVVDTLIPFADGRKNATFIKCQNLIHGIKNAVDRYYLGDIMHATQTFNTAMADGFDDWKKILAIPSGKNFYRSRLVLNGEQFARKDLFHVPFQFRSLVSTNRYSVPGFPALYLGDSTYVCWEEFRRHRLRDLSFSRFSNDRNLKVVDINLFKEFHNELMVEKDYAGKLSHILRYICTFPLILACTCQVRDRGGAFNPEYILPQLLLQYVSQQKDIDGIKFPSSWVDYNKLNRIEAYNYVFPVKTNERSGYCRHLLDAFSLTQPTSLEIEEVIDNPVRYFGTRVMIVTANAPSIELVAETISEYDDTSFGKLETILKRRKTDKLV
jgi:hypothetical protein